MANQAILNPNRAFDANGYTSPGARAAFYQTGTLTAVNVYSDEAGTIIAANPVIADADGTFPQRFVTEAVKVVVQNAEGATLYTLDPAPTVQALGSAASAVAFFPTLFIPDINVQNAIQTVDGNWRVAVDALDAGKQDADADLTAFAALSTTPGFVSKTAENSYAVRTFTEGAGIAITNGNGVSGNPTVAQLGVGIGQTWTDVDASRAVTAIYRNLTTKPIVVNIYGFTNTTAANYAEVSVDGVTFVRVGRTISASGGSSVSFVVPVNHYYRTTQSSGATVWDKWVELR